MTASDREPLCVAVNLLWCLPGRVGGSEEYLARQLLGLGEFDAGRHQRDRGHAGGDVTGFDTTLFCPPGFPDAHPELVDRHRMVTAPVSCANRPARVVLEHTWFAHRARGADVVHHGGGTLPVTSPGPTVLTVHDLQYETYPHYIPPAKLRYLRWVMPRSVARASVVTVPTEYVRTTVLDRFDADPDRVVVVPHGVEPDLGASAPTPEQLRERYRLGDGPVVVYPAITHPHKGHRFLLDVLAARRDVLDVRLVLLGGPGAVDAEVEAAIDRLGLRDRVVRPGRVPSADRDGLIALASVLAFPSEYEGFGAPVAEAMALGTPVVCSDQPALAEVAGDAGLVVPRDVDAWADALATAVASHDDLARAGRRQAERFTTAASGAALEAAYRLAVGAGDTHAGSQQQRSRP